MQILRLVRCGGLAQDDCRLLIAEDDSRFLVAEDDRVVLQLSDGARDPIQ
jgi:hypothetical protein